MVRIAVIVGLIALAGCREEEQGRLLHHEPGVYQGGAMPTLSDEQRAQLATRAQGQNF